MENAFIFLGIGGLIWIFTDIMKRGKKPETSPPEPEPAPPSSAFQKFYRTATGGTGAGTNYISAAREINRIARMYDAMRPIGAAPFFDLPDAQILAIIQRYKEGGAA